jgi:hypothetical protein
MTQGSEIDLSQLRYVQYYFHHITYNVVSQKMEIYHSLRFKSYFRGLQSVMLLHFSLTKKQPQIGRIHLSIVIKQT